MRLILLLLICAGSAFAHPGDLDENGGHTCRSNCEKYNLQPGEYHIHRPAETEKEQKTPKSSLEHKENTDKKEALRMKQGTSKKKL